MPSVHVNLGERSYDIVIASGRQDYLQPFLSTMPGVRKAIVVTDDHVRPHADAVVKSLASISYHSELVVLPPGEEQKSLATLSHLYDLFVERRVDRHTIVVAVGGGVIGDLAGFAAATFNRGLPLYMVPTTLLAMVDSSVGGKVGINHARGKNLIGAFHQPRGVWIELDSLATLPEREFRSGLAEVVKYGIIADPELFEALEGQTDLRDPPFLEYIIQRSCQLKADVVEADERETQGTRQVLNFGHTFAHAFETVAGYGSLLHGEAVAIGMACASKLAVQMNWFDEVQHQRLVNLLTRMELPTVPDSAWPLDSLLDTMRHDKKNDGGKLRFVLPRWIGKVEHGVPVEENLVREVLTQAAGCHA